MKNIKNALGLAFGLIVLNLTSPKNSLADALGNSNCGTTEIYTAIGCVPVLNDDGGASFATFLIKWGISVGGGIAFLLILYGSFMVMTSQGNPERLKAGQELLTSAISGLLLLIFSVFVLNFLGVNILGIFS